VLVVRWFAASSITDTSSAGVQTSSLRASCRITHYYFCYTIISYCIPHTAIFTQSKLK
jgi:hypothetical protein